MIPSLQLAKANWTQGPLRIEGISLSRNANPPRPVKPAPMTPTENKLKPVPRNAPRNIETKGKYTIRKGVRIRDYRVPARTTNACLSPSSSPEFQCRDGFDSKETCSGRLPPRTIRRCGKKSLERQPISPRQVPPSQPNDSSRRTASRSPSLGTGDNEYHFLTTFEAIQPNRRKEVEFDEGETIQ